ncbi:hypothetical protein [Streptomyces mirabilis]|uniref:imine reductase family protein n=1 Tax=Streptomyces mirabilis TaxID=68239 RepID=UPI0033BBAEED
MSRAAVRSSIDAATAHGLEVGALTAAKGAADRAVAAGHGPDGLPRLATVLRTGKPPRNSSPKPRDLFARNGWRAPTHPPALAS